MITCLAMMARDSAEVVLRAIESARPFVDRMVLAVAPGDPLLSLESTIPCRKVEQPWLGHAATRTATLRHVEDDPDVDWVLMLDARATIAGMMPPLDEDIDADAYEIQVEDIPSGWRWMRNGHLMRARQGFSWAGTAGTGLHELMHVPPNRVIKTWHGLVLRATPSPKTTAGRTYAEDAERFRVALERDPTNARVAFYYAQSLKDAGQYANAFLAFRHRSLMTSGSLEETFWALMWSAKLAKVAGQDCVPLYLEALDILPDRAEPHAGLEHHYRWSGQHDLAYAHAVQAAACPYPIHARSFVDTGAYSAEARAAAGIAH